MASKGTLADAVTWSLVEFGYDPDPSARSGLRMCREGPTAVVLCWWWEDLMSPWHNSAEGFSAASAAGEDRPDYSAPEEVERMRALSEGLNIFLRCHLEHSGFRTDDIGVAEIKVTRAGPLYRVRRWLRRQRQRRRAQPGDFVL
ncbi:hypothetical protein [Streptomyces klenkii]|uniref:hypothetical protein n=1 Tax=Streptomyces klenkii TaxID=1420899 RepID=UPI00344711BB